MIKKSGIDNRLRSLERGIKFLKQFGRKSYYRSKEKMELDEVINRISSNSLGEEQKNHFFQRHLRKLIFVYNFGFWLSLTLLIIILPLLTLDYNSEFFETYQADISLIIAFILLSILSFCFGNLLLNLSRLNLIKKIIFRNKKVILKDLFIKWDLEEIKLLNSTSTFDLIQINFITLFVPRHKKNKRVILISEWKSKDILKISKKNILSAFEDDYKNGQFLELLKSKEIFSLFKEFKIDFNKNEKSILELRHKISIDQLLALIFIVFIYSIYAKKTERIN